jgi:hypothetical protein
MIRAKKLAIRRTHIQLNGPGMVRFALFDIDRPDAAFADEAAGVAPPNIAMVNPDNGHAHLVYVLAHPVLVTDAARDGPLRFLAAIQRGMVRRLGADPSYTGLIAKNPLSSRWRVRWAAPFPYNLADLDGFLTREDKRPAPRREVEMGIGRNVALFDELRHQAYAEVLDFKRRGLCLSTFENRLRAIAGAANATFDLSTGGPLPLREVRSISRSVARFCYRHFSSDAFARIQRHRAETRTRQHLTAIGEIKRNASP